MIKNKRIAFFGTGGVFSNIVLKKLIKNKVMISLVVILVKKDSKLEPLNKRLCKENNIPHIIIWDTNTDCVIDNLKNHEIDLGIVASYSQILKLNLIQSLDDGFINIHPSYLPLYKGANPIFWQIKSLKDEFGVTVHRITEKIDEGEILAQNKFILSDEMTGDKILKVIAEQGSELILKLLNTYFQTGKLNTYNINPDALHIQKGFYNPKPSEKDFQIKCLKISPDILARLVFRMKKWGLAYIINGDKKLVIENIEAIDMKNKGDYCINIEDDKIYVKNEFGSFIIKVRKV